MHWERPQLSGRRGGPDDASAQRWPISHYEIPITVLPRHLENLWGEWLVYLSLNTAVSFITNTNWQNCGGQSTLCRWPGPSASVERASLVGRPSEPRRRGWLVRFWTQRGFIQEYRAFGPLVQ
jgi:hypothetical protein